MVDVRHVSPWIDVSRRMTQSAQETHMTSRIEVFSTDWRLTPSCGAEVAARRREEVRRSMRGGGLRLRIGSA
jgi:hypothetical protein